MPVEKNRGEIRRKRCGQKGVEILEAEAGPGHITSVSEYSALYKGGTMYGISQGKPFVHAIG